MLPLYFLCLGLLHFASTEPVTGPTCGSSGRSCVSSEATCDADTSKCRCQDPFAWGKGNFRCYKDSVVGCEIKNDPTLTTYSKESEQFAFPCRFLASHVRQDMQNEAGDVIGSCEARVWVSNVKNKGKIFVSSYDVGLKLRYNNPRRIVESSFRRFAYVDNTINTDARWGQEGQSYPFVPNGHDVISYTDTQNGIRVRETFSELDNRFTYTAQGCGIKITFVPYDRELNLEQEQVPGVAIGVSKLHNPTFLSSDKVMCLAPPNLGGQLIDDVKYSSLTRERSLLLRAFKATYVQNQYLGDGSTCTEIGGILNDCQAARQKQAIRKCDWMLKQAHFLKCYDETVRGERILHLFKLCAQAWCSNQPCTGAISAIRTSGCTAVEGVDELGAFLNGNMCPEP